jgi:hypothetical protein
MASLLGSMIQGIHSAQQYDDAMEAIGKLPDYKDYKPVSELASLYSDLKGLSKDPLKPSQGAFDAMLGQSSANAYQRGISADPSLSGAIMTGMNTAGLQQGAQRQLQGDQLRMNYLSQLGNVSSAFQEMANMNVNRFNTNLNQQEVALGNAAAQAKQSASEAWVQFGDESEAKTGKIMSMIFGGGMGGGAGQQTPTTNSASGASSGGMYQNAGGFGQQPQQQTGTQQIDASAWMNTFCWVARTVYGENNPKWMEFRAWITTQAPKVVLDTYIKHGERIAEYITDKPVLKFLIRKLMDTILYWNKPSVSIA